MPIVEPEVLMDGSHSIERCEQVTGAYCTRCSMRSLTGRRTEGMLLKPNMVIAGPECPVRPRCEEVATATLRCLRRHVRRRFLGSCSCRAARRNGWRPPPRCDQPAARAEALDDQLFIRACAAGPGAGGVARTRREPGRRRAGDLPARALQQRRQLGAYTRDGRGPLEAGGPPIAASGATIKPRSLVQSTDHSA